MHHKEIVDAICEHHRYEYVIVNALYEIVEYSAQASLYCDLQWEEDRLCNLFCAVPELVGMEGELALLLEGKRRVVSVPLIFKPPHYYVDVYVYRSKASTGCMVLFEDITEKTYAEQKVAQVHNENLLLLDEIAEQNRRLELFSQHMKTLVEEEVAKNAQQQHMLELQTRHAQMGEMIAIITHQWKQPLSVIQTICTNLKIKYELGQFSADLAMEKIQNIDKQIQLMGTIVADFQHFFKPSKAKSRFHLNAAIHSLIGLVKAEYTHANIALQLEELDEVWLEGYPNEYNQVILSILQNAKEAFLCKPFDAMQIHIRIAKQHEKSYVRISDNAGGIPLEILPKIFDQYETSKAEGSGLGLYIAKSVIEHNMGGKIWAENSEEGAVFYIVV